MGIYKRTISTVERFVPSKLQPLWQHPAGPKTIFFWAPIFKWGLVIAGLHDLKRPAETLNPKQSLVLVVSGLIWSRYSFVIIPVNYSLFSVNMFVAITQGYQFKRAVEYQLQKPKK